MHIFLFWCNEEIHWDEIDGIVKGKLAHKFSLSVSVSVAFMVGHSACVSVNASFVIGWSLCVKIKVLCVIDYSVCVLIKSFVIDHSLCVPIIMSCVIDNRYSSPVHFLIVILLLKMVNF